MQYIFVTGNRLENAGRLRFPTLASSNITAMFLLFLLLYVGIQLNVLNYHSQFYYLQQFSFASYGQRYQRIFSSRIKYFYLS